MTCIRAESKFSEVIEYKMTVMGSKIYYAPIIYSRTKNEDFSNHLTFAPVECSDDKQLFDKILNYLDSLSHSSPLKRCIFYINRCTIYGNFCYVETLCPNKQESKYSHIDTRKTVAFIGICFKNSSKTFPVSDEKLLNLFEKNIGTIWDLPIGNSIFDKTIITEYAELDCDVHPDLSLQEWCRDAVRKIETADKTEQLYMFYDDKGHIKDEKQSGSFWSRLFPSSKGNESNFIEKKFAESSSKLTDTFPHSSNKDPSSVEPVSPKKSYGLGRDYEMGKHGLPIDFKIAAEYYMQAAKCGHADAQYCLGCLYADGRGVSKDLKEAKKWILNAVEQGHEKAKEKLKELSISETSEIP